MRPERNSQWKYVRDQLQYTYSLLQLFPTGATLAELIIAIEEAEAELLGLDQSSLDENKRGKVEKDERIYRNAINKFRHKYRMQIIDPELREFFQLCGSQYVINLK